MQDPVRGEPGVGDAARQNGSSEATKGPSADAIATPTDQTRRTSTASTLLTGASLAFAAALLFAFTANPSWLAGATVFPAWLWAALGASLCALSLGSRRTVIWKLSLLLWLAFATCFVEEPRSVVRGWWQRPVSTSDDQKLRVVSVNCYVGNPQVLEDLLLLNPDLVLIQESPKQDVLKEWATALYGEQSSVVAGVDCSLIARGQLIPQGAPQRAPFVHALWRPYPGRELQVVSLRLWPQPFRLDFWNRAFWQAFQDVRRKHLQEMDQIVNTLQQHKGAMPVIVGGDFNAPAGDPVDRPLAAQGLADVFSRVGAGWGNTITNQFPFHRIDRIWVSPHVKPLSAQAIRSKVSDHRLLSCDVELPPQE